MRGFRTPTLTQAIVGSTVVVLALMTVHLQVTSLKMSFIETEQVQRHFAVLNGTALNPWQYRVLSEYVIEAVAFLPRRLGIGNALVLTFVIVRVAQNAAVLLAAYVYFRRLSISPAAAILGLNLLALIILQADLESDLSFNTYFDVLFYLLAAISVLAGGTWSVVAITALAAFNRETSALIPLLPLAAWTSAGNRARRVQAVAAGLLLYGTIFLAIRLWYGARPLMLGWNHPPGISMFLFNMRRYAWVRMVATFGTLPLLALAGYRRWPAELKAFCWIIVPVWFSVHVFSSVMTETRLYLVPLVIVVLPASLLIGAQGFELRTS
jgi:hypothetical protein